MWSDAVFISSVVVIAGCLVWAGTHEPPVRLAGVRGSSESAAATISLDAAQLLGSPRAAVVLVEFADFQCAYCGEFARDTLPKLKELYVGPGHLLFAFMHLPAPVRSSALAAAEAAECAGQLGLFWDFHDRLFAAQPNLDQDRIMNLASSIGVSIEQSAAGVRCARGSVRTTIADQSALAHELGIQGTPWFAVGLREGSAVRVSRTIRGAKSAAEFAAAIDELLRRTREASK
jgi:protein-disulfide isomerase